jgi:polar amino acid transport system substrate-binding protein
MNPRRCFVLGVSLAIAATACSSISADDTASRQAKRGLSLLAAGPTTTTVPSPPCKTTADTARSFAPQGPLPPPGQMRAGSYMAKIQRRGYLIAGVDQNTLGFGYRGPSGQIEGFDVDMVFAIAQAIFGHADANTVRLVAVTSAQRESAIESSPPQVDLVASLMSITCDRWRRLAFSTEYYAAKQSVLVRADSPIKHVSDLNGKRVCATQGSTSIDQIHKFAPRAILDRVDLRPECLVHLQEGLADAVSTDDTILYGLHHQDLQNTRLLTDDLKQPERYGIAINRGDPDFVRFVNAVLEQVRTDGRWEKFHHDELETKIGIPPALPPAPKYFGQP